MKTREEILKSAASGNKDADLKVISLGMGVQSTALYLMSSMGYKVPRADVAVFSDPQAEHYKTYEMLKWLLKWKEDNNGIDIIFECRSLSLSKSPGFQFTYPVKCMNAELAVRGTYAVSP